MVALRVALAVEEISGRMRQRLHGTSDIEFRQIVWEQHEARILIYSHTFRVRALKGWLICSLDVQTDQAGRATLQFIFYLGAEVDAGPHASATINASTREAAEIADRWGHDLLRVLWDGVLDGIEATIKTASVQLAGRRLALAGIFLTPEELFVDVVAGDN
jgi:hypothetical protein